MEYYKTYCSVHPYEQINNFCVDQQCLVGLCPTCICEHTKHHMKKGTSPQYENIKTTQLRVNQKMRKQIDLIEGDKLLLDNICVKIDQKKQKIKQSLLEARSDCLNMVNKFFNELEIKIDSQIQNQSKRNSLHSQYRLQNLNALILKEISTLIFYSKDLNSNKFLDTVKHVQTDILVNSADFHNKISRQLKQNETYTPGVTYKPESVEELVLSLKRIVKLQFILPRTDYTEDSKRQISARQSKSLKKSNSTSQVNVPHRIIPLYVEQKNNFIESMKLKHTTPVIFPQPRTIEQILNLPIRNNSQILNNQSLMKTSMKWPISNLKTIRQSKREGHQQLGKTYSFTCSEVSEQDKQNLAHSTFYDTGSSFFR